MENKSTNIKECELTSCAYNDSKKCHAKAITVGGSHPRCDTFFRMMDQKGGFSEDNAMVGACKVKTCSFNRMLECSADAIQVGLHNGHPDCKTYTAAA